MERVQLLKWFKRRLKHALDQEECYDYLYVLLKDLDKEILEENGGITRQEYFRLWFQEKVAYIKYLLHL